jgi:hypothetical protein
MKAWPRPFPARLALAAQALVAICGLPACLDVEESLGSDPHPDGAVPADAYAPSDPSDAGDASDAGEPDAPDATGLGAPTDEATQELGRNGCIVNDDDAGLDAGIECRNNESSAGLMAVLDGGVVSSTAGKLPGTLIAGHAYTFYYGRGLALSAGNPVTVDVYGSNAPEMCNLGEKLFTMALDNSLVGTKAYCFVPQKNYGYAVVNVSIQGVWIYKDLGTVTGTLCDGCRM